MIRTQPFVMEERLIHYRTIPVPNVTWKASAPLLVRGNQPLSNAGLESRGRRILRPFRVALAGRRISALRRWLTSAPASMIWAPFIHDSSRRRLSAFGGALPPD